MRRTPWLCLVAVLAAACSDSTAAPGAPNGISYIGLPANVNACEPMPALEVSAIRDGRVATDFTGDVTVSIAPGTGIPASVLSGTRTMRALAGVATFSGLSINAAGSGYRLMFDAADVGATTTQSFSVSQGGAYQLAFTAVPPQTVSGLALPPVRVAVRDACGSPISTAATPITLSLNTNGASASLLGTLTVNAANGVASFLDLSVSKAGPGLSLGASANGLVGAQSLVFTVAPAPAR